MSPLLKWTRRLLVVGLAVAALLTAGVYGGSALVRAESVDGHACFRIRGQQHSGDATELWIEQSTYLVLRKTERMHISEEARLKMRDMTAKAAETFAKDDPRRVLADV